MIAPFDTPRGNLSGTQILQYAENNNPAFQAPLGRQYARNYKTRYIGAKRSSDGLSYFMVKTKSATFIKAETLQNMALMGGAGAIIAAILADKSSTAYLMVVDAWEKRTNKSVTLRKFMTDIIRTGLASKAPDFIFLTTAGAQIANPWNTSAQAAIKVEISQEVLVKFWLQLGSNGTSAAPIYFTVAGMKGISFFGQSFSDLIAIPSINILGLVVSEEQATQYYIMKDDLVVKYNNEIVTDSDTIFADRKYILAAV